MRWSHNSTHGQCQVLPPTLFSWGRNWGGGSLSKCQKAHGDSKNLKRKYSHLLGTEGMGKPPTCIPRAVPPPPSLDPGLCAPVPAPPLWREPVTPELGRGPVNTQVKAICSCVSAMPRAWRKGHRGPACGHPDSLHEPQWLSALFY